MRMTHSISGYITLESGPFRHITWKVPNFFHMPPTDGYFVESPEFSFADATWCLTLFPNGCSEVHSGYVDITLLRLRSSIPEHKVHIEMALLTRRGKTYELSVWEERYDSNPQYGERFYCTERSKIVRQSQLLVPDGTVTVVCHIRVMQQAFEETLPQAELGEASSDPPESVSQEEDVRRESPSVKKLQLDYKKLLDSGEESDVSLVVSGRVFHAHKCILRVRSPVFGAMFNHETEEKSSGKVVIEDLDPECFQEFLEHLYTGRVEVLSDENAFSLYTAADKYDAQALKSECREYMQRTLSVDTFCDVITLALRYQEQELVTHATDFFSKNLSKIITTVKWQIFMRENSTEANELLIKAIVPKEEKK